VFYSLQFESTVHYSKYVSVYYWGGAAAH